MKKLFIVAAIMAVSFVFNNAASCNSSLEAKSKMDGGDSIKKEFNVKPEGEVNINLKTGASIEVKGWDKDLLSAEVSGNTSKVDFNFEQNDNDIEISSEYKDKGHSHNDHGIKVTVYVPQKYDVRFYTMGGQVDVDHVEGKINGKTMGGNLNFSDLKADLDVMTMGGQINFKNSDLEGLAKTMGGNVFLENVRGSVDASTMGGNVKQINATSDNKTNADVVNVKTMGGEISIDKAPNGANLKTLGGNISINYAGKFLKAETLGGNITAKEVDGEINAKTLGGNVDVTMTGNPEEGKRDVTISSLGGDITLTVPKDLSMSVEIEISYTKNSDKDFSDCKIYSDFNIVENRIDKWETRNDEQKKKYVLGSGEINGGKNKITIKTYNGSVYLKKS